MFIDNVFNIFNMFKYMREGVILLKLYSVLFKRYWFVLEGNFCFVNLFYMYIFIEYGVY